ncbi:MAG: hydantoinase/oxoprolinase N-terminal domain-containing protein, partial [Dehalococcoidia bacterium]
MNRVGFCRPGCRLPPHSGAHLYTVGMLSVLGVDVGGTFTDFVFLRDGTLQVFKRPSTPDDPSRGVLEGMREAG